MFPSFDVIQKHFQVILFACGLSKDPQILLHFISEREELKIKEGNSIDTLFWSYVQKELFENGRIDAITQKVCE